MPATVHVLTAGYAEERVASTVTLLRDGATTVVVDPGMVADRRSILDPLAALGLTAEQITDVIFSHHHLDHTLNAALFPRARFHDHMAIYQDDTWYDRDADGFAISEHIRLLRTPGHTPEDITTLAHTDQGLVALTHLWWQADGPLQDPFAHDPALLAASRRALLALAPALIVPGHGHPFVPTEQTPV
ncbi:MBL fold metallo-hydrolase [Kitasatospora sp. MMS16-BH015]|uniref:MBL fold metallo-hydrolase n=1 Tax=Kitasatospora sp. MMS16-BH015 TaxID=2018025 RepID=UPI000CA29197|nr:MBL fold metallo-hydrolase [Kitasatospora sp. MMS16-BH015]AUG75015.1 MBL fold metallo-hydrolase [Kitasatospora sp. MMS16-BH015]